MKNKTINFNQSGEIKFTGKNWKNVVRAIPSEARILLVSGIKDSFEVCICVSKKREHKKSVKTIFLTKTFVGSDGQVIDRRTYLMNLMKINQYDSIRIQWGMSIFNCAVVACVSENNIAA